MKTFQMKVFKVNPEAQLPEFATAGSGAFDVRACLAEGGSVVTYNPHNRQVIVPVKMNRGVPFIRCHPQFRLLIPTGLIFDIPAGNVIKIFPRSGLATKLGLVLANQTAIIDSDYVDETIVIVHNNSDTPVDIVHGDRIAQGRLEKNLRYAFEEASEAPERTTRNGGIGSTGVE
ncbi:MAG: dUTP diphosphatase [Anaerolineaceae bacterium]